tara:strand:+ start:2344 stop:2667 length:324 start_codon:yes stop_codon:yes gene_type:complete
MSLRKASRYLFVSIFIVCAAKLFVMIKINELSSEVSQLNEEIKLHEKEIQELQVEHHNLYSPQRIFELAKEYDFVRVERRIEKNGLLRPYDMSKVEEINPDVLGISK